MSRWLKMSGHCPSHQLDVPECNEMLTPNQLEPKTKKCFVIPKWTTINRNRNNSKSASVNFSATADIAAGVAASSWPPCLTHKILALNRTCYVTILVGNMLKNSHLMAQKMQTGGMNCGQQSKFRSGASPSVGFVALASSKAVSVSYQVQKNV